MDTGEDGTEVRVVEGGFETSVLEANASIGVATQEMEGDVADDGEVLGSMIGVDARAVLVEGQVEHPVEAVLDAPMAANDPLEQGGISRQAGDVVAYVGRYGRADAADRLDADHAPELRRGVLRVAEGEGVRVAKCSLILVGDTAAILSSSTHPQC